jgi:hypothetical protein
MNTSIRLSFILSLIKTKFLFNNFTTFCFPLPLLLCYFSSFLSSNFHHSHYLSRSSSIHVFPAVDLLLTLLPILTFIILFCYFPPSVSIALLISYSFLFCFVFLWSHKSNAFFGLLLACHFFVCSYSYQFK